MVVVYIDMVADLFHMGHVNILQKAKSLGDTLMVGIHSDEVVESYKRKPILSMEERIAVVESCRYVDRVVPNAPLHVTPEYLNSLGVDIIVHGDDISDKTRSEFYGEVIDRYKEFKYTENISTTDILRRVKVHLQK